MARLIDSNDGVAVARRGAIDIAMRAGALDRRLIVRRGGACQDHMGAIGATAPSFGIGGIESGRLGERW